MKNYTNTIKYLKIITVSILLIACSGSPTNRIDSGVDMGGDARPLQDDFGAPLPAFDLSVPGDLPVVNVSTCAEITAPGIYRFTQDLPGTAACIRAHDTQNLVIDCAGHTIDAQYGPLMTVDHVQHFMIRNCTLAVTGLYNPLAITDSSDGVLTNNHFTGVTDATSVTGLTVAHNTFTGTFQQSYSAHSFIVDNTLSFVSTEMVPAVASMIISNLGHDNIIARNQMHGGWTVRLPPLSYRQGADDGIVVTDENNDLVQENSIAAVWDCGIETTGTVVNSRFIANTIVDAGVCGIGGWYWSSWTGNQVLGNHVSTSAELFLFYREHGLRPQNWDNHNASADTGVYFNENLFEANDFQDPLDYSYFYSYAASDIPLFERLAYDGRVSSFPGEVAPTDEQFYLTNNRFKNNRFGSGRAAPRFGQPTVPGRIVDEDGNSCTAPTTPG